MSGGRTYRKEQEDWSRSRVRHVRSRGAHAYEIRGTASSIERDEISISRFRESAPRRLAPALLDAHTQNHIQPHQLVRLQILEHAGERLRLVAEPRARTLIAHQANGVGHLAIRDLLQDEGQTFE